MFAKVNLLDYVKAKGADVTEYIRENKSMATISYKGIKKTYTLNGGIMDDAAINKIFGFSSFLANEERNTGVGIGIRDNKLNRDTITPIKDHYDLDLMGIQSDLQWTNIR